MGSGARGERGGEVWALVLLFVGCLGLVSPAPSVARNSTGEVGGQAEVVGEGSASDPAAEIGESVSERISAVRRVRIDLERFVRERVGSGAVSIEMPPLVGFETIASASSDDPAEAPAYRTELRTRSSEPLRGRVPITVALYSGERLMKRSVVSPYVRETMRVVSAGRNLARGAILSTSDVRTVDVDAARVPNDAIADADSVVGLRAKRSLRKGQVLRDSAIEGVPVVERGDRVTLVLESGRLTIQAVGRAQEAGTIGDWIRVENLDSKRELSGRVDREGRVHVAF